MTIGNRAESGRRAPVVWMFPGQGAQYYGMGRAHYERGGIFRYWMDRLDAVAADYVGQSVVDILYDGATSIGQPFDQILYTHPALFMVQYAAARTLLAEGFPAPDVLFGSSLGEFVAAAVAGTAEPEAMLFDLIKQARLFEAQCGGGAMLAVIAEAELFHTDPAFAGRCELAGVNFDRCFVVSGRETDIRELAAHLARRDVAHQMLPVPVAFHSSLVDPVEDIFLRTFSGAVRRPSEIPILSCVEPAEDHGAATPAVDWWRIIRQPIAFQKALEGFARDHGSAVYLDLGPSGNMATFTKYNLPKDRHDRIIPIMTPTDRAGGNVALARDRLSALP
ncbi:MAG TPA: acyltransferase domain-containing protein [Azospirillum sp.]